jgi:hypothetical protein
MCIAFIAFFSGSRALAMRVWKNERAWGLSQSQKIMHKWKGTQRSSVIEYFVLRSALMDDDFANVRLLTNDDADARELTRRALENVASITPVPPREGDSLRFTCEIPEALEMALDAWLSKFHAASISQ